MRPAARRREWKRCGLRAQLAGGERGVNRDVARALLGVRPPATPEAHVAAGLPDVEPVANSVGQQVDAAHRRELVAPRWVRLLMAGQERELRQRHVNLAVVGAGPEAVRIPELDDGLVDGPLVPRQRTEAPVHHHAHLQCGEARIPDEVIVGAHHVGFIAARGLVHVPQCHRDGRGIEHGRRPRSSHPVRADEERAAAGQPEEREDAVAGAEDVLGLLRLVELQRLAVEVKELDEIGHAGTVVEVTDGLPLVDALERWAHACEEIGEGEEGLGHGFGTRQRALCFARVLHPVRHEVASGGLPLRRDQRLALTARRRRSRRRGLHPRGSRSS